MSDPVNALSLRIREDMKQAMKAKEKEKLSVIRLILAAIKQKEVDERTELDDAQVLQLLDKMVKQRRDSIEAYDKAGRDDLSVIEQKETLIIQQYLPQQLTESEIDQLIDQAISDSGAEGMKDMGKVMGILRPQLQGRADVGAASGKIKAKLS
ncbi:MAG: glutamyl-tRNA amidotransferase [Cycloclasticus sp.]|nr:glutamyl-tRNA amidotransferase [Cycloclasticus sp.]MBG95784.1 glutamyl-tRNA amidotransferase [Cycloclasticus sp.]HAI96178.1 glutamyl-tRNA amidotransferase [Methylococcaceae bacterium]|tara:strand:+ start:684 stop:1142 length:459 start_codon:yes stop_codon:yes gene_type:complete